MQAAKMDHDLGPGRAARRRRVRRLPAARRRLAVRDQGRPDPRRPARARRGAGRRGAGRPGAGDPARPPDVGRRADACPACARRSGLRRGRHRRPRRRRRGRGAGPRAGRARWRPAGWDAGASRRRRSTDDRRRSQRCCGSRPPRWCRGWPAPRDEIDQILHALDGGFIPAGPVGLAAARAWSTCCRPAATSTPSTPRRCRRGWPGRPVRRWPTRCWTATAPTTAS